MDQSVSFKIGEGNKSDRRLINKLSIENEKKGSGLSFYKKGQLIKGVVISADEQVTLDFNGQQVSVLKDIISNAVPGETKTFEVVNANDREIELRVLGDNSAAGRKTFRTVIEKDTDWGSIRAQKDQTAKRTERETEFQETFHKLEDISSRLTELDCKELEKEGFPIETFTVSGLYEALNRIKTGISSGEQSVKEKNFFDKADVADRLKRGNLPVTDENITKLVKALDLSNMTEKLDEKAMKYLISNEAKPTPENIYKACYSGSTLKQIAPGKFSAQAWKELEGQVTEVIQTAGYEVNEENLSAAKWILENELPLTADSFTYKKKLEEMKSGLDQDIVLDKMIEGMKEGLNPKDVSLLPQKEASFDKLITDINSIKEETVAYAVQQGAELTINNLVSVQEKTQSDEEEKADSISNRYEETRALRQLEEIRLKMTREAAMKLEKKGFSIETEKLEKVVEELKKLEDSYYKELCKEADYDASERSLEILKETTQSIEKLKYIPCAVLGSTLSIRNEQTISGLLSDGTKLQTELSKAGTAYETLMTVPNREYGDSIKKAFANMDSLLAELNLDNTEQNQRAVRILGYNRMEITEESVNKVKAYDIQVAAMMKNLHPAVTVRMIKEGINPLEMPISELNQTIDRIKEEQGITSEEKYSTYLQRLEKGNEISAEERKAYIGIYRLLYNVEKADGAALGAVIKANREVTLDKLLTAVQTSKKGRLEAVIDDEFGTLQSISHKKETITEQLSAFTGGAGQDQHGQPDKDSLVAEQVEYLDRILKQMKEEITPEKLREAGLSFTQAAASASAMSSSGSVFSSGSGIWETMKAVPVEKLYEQIQNAETKNQTEQEELYTGKVQEIRELCNNSEQSIRFLNDFKMPSTPLNLMIANHILSNGESPVKKLLKQKENIVENSENGLKEMNELSDTLIDKHSMQEAYEQLETDAKAALNQAYSEEKIDSRKLAELKSIGQQMTFIRTLAGKEFYQIPIETDQGVTNINLTILRGTENSGRVTVTVQSELLGNIRADFSLKDQILKGFFSSDNRSGLEQLQKYAGDIEQAASEYELTIKQMDFGIQRRDNDTYSYQYPDNEAKSNRMSNDTERKLYRIAKAIVQTVRRAENSETELSSAVS
jgi:hypothetical protein